MSADNRIAMNTKTSSQVYRQLARMIESGLPISEIISSEMLPQIPNIRKIEKLIANGDSLAQSFSKTRALPAKDILLIKAGEESGKLGEIFSTLATRYEEKAKSLAEIKRKLAYPAFLLFFAGVVLPLPQLIIGNLTVIGFVFKIAALWTLFFLFGFGLYAFFSGLTSDSRGSALNRWVMQKMPFAGKFIVSWHLEDYFSTLGLMLHAGIPLIRASEQACETIPSLFFKKHLRRTGEKISQGKNLSEAYEGIPFLTKEHHLLIRSGEKTGMIDESFLRIGSQFREQNQFQLSVFTAILPKVIYFAVMIYVGAQIISYYLGYFDMLNDLTKQI